MFVRQVDLDPRIREAMLQPVVWSQKNLTRLLEDQGSEPNRACSQASYVLGILAEEELPDFVEFIRAGVSYELAYGQVLSAR